MRTEDIFRSLGFAPKQHRNVEVFQIDTLMGSSGIYEKDRDDLMTLTSAVRSSIQDKKNLAGQVESIQDYYLTRLILDRVIHDTLFRFVEDDFPFIIQGVGEDAKKQIMGAYKDLDMTSVLLEMMPTFLALGEYLYVWDDKNKELDDYIPQAYWRAVYTRGKISAIILDTLGFSLFEDHGDKRRELDDEEIVDLLKKNGVVATLRSLPRAIKPTDPSKYRYRIYEGRGIFTPGIIALIRAIHMMEEVIPILQVLSADSRYIVKVRVPEGANHKEVMKLVRMYSRFLNQINEAALGDDVESLKEKLGRFKVTPVFGDKGDVDYDEIPHPQEPNLEAIQLFKSNLVDALPIDPEYLGLPVEEKTQKVGYYKLLYAIRRDLANFVEDVLKRYLKNRVEDFNIIAAPVLGSDELARADYLDMVNLSVDNISRIVQTFTDFAERSPNAVNLEAYANLINKMLNPITGGSDIVSVPPAEEGEDQGGNW